MTSASIWAVRAVHPEWWPRIIRSSITTDRLWRAQGRPTEIPVVLHAGQLIANEAGTGGMIANWSFSFRHVGPAGVSIEVLWRELVARGYPVQPPGTPVERDSRKLARPLTWQQRRTRQAAGIAVVATVVWALTRAVRSRTR